MYGANNHLGVNGISIMTAIKAGVFKAYKNELKRNRKIIITFYNTDK